MVRDHRIETYMFPAGSLVGANLSIPTWRSINGLLLGVNIQESNFAATGSLFLKNNLTGQIEWSMQSGTSTGNVAQSGTYYPVVSSSSQNNVLLSGTNYYAYSELPLYGEYTLIGSGLGASKSGLGITLIYKMG